MKVKSSRIAEIHYDKNERKLIIHFHEGGKYIYHNVSEHVYDSMLDAKSHGKHFDKHIKGKYKHTKG